MESSSVTCQKSQANRSAVVFKGSAKRSSKCALRLEIRGVVLVEAEAGASGKESQRIMCSGSGISMNISASVSVSACARVILEISERFRKGKCAALEFESRCLKLLLHLCCKDDLRQGRCVSDNIVTIKI